MRVENDTSNIQYLASVLLCIGGYFSQICWAICFIKMSEFRYKRVIGVGFVHERGNTEKQFRNSKSGAPFVFENVETDTTRCADVWM